MRALAVALLVVLLMAGCTKTPPPASTTTTTPKAPPLDDLTPAPTPTPSSPSATPSTPSSPPTTPTPPTNGTTNATTNASTVTPAYVNLTHDFAGADKNVTVTVPNDGLKYNVSVDFDPGVTPVGTLACAGRLQITVTMPNGTVWEDVLAVQDPNAQAGTHCARVDLPSTPLPIVPGKWHVAFTSSAGGVGIGTFVLSI